MKQRHVAIPAEHGAWVFLLSPLLIGLFAGGRWTMPGLYLVIAALGAFLARQPATLVVKVWSGRRSREVLPAAVRWLVVYGAVCLSFAAGLLLRGFGFVLWLGVPAAPVLGWHLWLVARREERRQWLVEIVGAGALALAAPAAYWVGSGRAEPDGWWLWLLTWAQSSASILYAYLRLEQRPKSLSLPLRERLRMGVPALAASLANLLGALALGLYGVVGPWLFAAYAPQHLEAIRGTLRTAAGHKPRTIGFRQLSVSALYTVLFVLLWGVPGRA